MRSTTAITTPKASSYLQQLCKHFGHKIPVEFTETAGTITFEMGTARLNADADTLHMTVEGEPDAIDRLEGVMASHLERFAFREELSILWTRAE